MSRLASRVFVISDLHLGGVYSESGKTNDRGFRICTHASAVAEFVDRLAALSPTKGHIQLVLNGDTVDFLAERNDADPPWTAFTADPTLAVRKLEAIVDRDRPVFDSFGRFLKAGHRLVVLLGNHDIELSLPAVRRRFAELMGVEGHHDYEFIYDGEGYVVGDALIEHGNRYDPFNIVDFGALRALRSLQSRHQDVPTKHEFDAPAGSEMVSTVINPIKEDYRFIDLLKPEGEAVVPLLLALEPGYRRYLVQAANLAAKAVQHLPEGPGLPRRQGDIASEAGTGKRARGGDMAAIRTTPTGRATESTDEAVLSQVLARALGSDARSFLDEIEALDRGPDTSAANIGAHDFVDRAVGFARLLLAKKGDDVERRLPMLLKALRGLEGRDSFRTDVEDPRYLDPATTLATHGIRHVVFGHTHKPKQLRLPDGGFYLNSGTWADMLKFPVEILAGSDAEALQHLRRFVQSMAAGDFSSWTLFHPTFVQLELDENGKVTEAKLCQATRAE